MPDAANSRVVGKGFFKKNVTVGIDIGVDDLKLAAVSAAGDKIPELVDYVSLSFESDLKKDTSRFSRFLKTALTDFCSSCKKTEIWCIISSARVETRYIRIRKFPAGKLKMQSTGPIKKK